MVYDGFLNDKGLYWGNKIVEIDFKDVRILFYFDS